VVSRAFSVKRQNEKVYTGFCGKTEQEPKENISQEISKKNMQPYVLMKFVLGGSNLVAAGFELPKFTAQHRKNFQ
jgi:hypothetical protein